MLEDLQPPVDYEQKAKDLEKELQKAHGLLKEARDEIIKQRDNNDHWKKSFVDTFNDAKRFAQRIKDMNDVIEQYRDKRVGDFDDLGDLNHWDDEVSIEVDNLEEDL